MGGSDIRSIVGTAADHACHCVGPRPGEPRCPCAMRGVIIRDGRYVLPERDLGPVAPRPNDHDRRSFRPFDVSNFWKF